MGVLLVIRRRSGTLSFRQGRLRWLYSPGSSHLLPCKAAWGPVHTPLSSTHRPRERNPGRPCSIPAPPLRPCLATSQIGGDKKQPSWQVSLSAQPAAVGRASTQAPTGQMLEPRSAQPSPSGSDFSPTPFPRLDPAAWTAAAGSRATEGTASTPEVEVK